MQTSTKEKESEYSIERGSGVRLSTESRKISEKEEKGKGQEATKERQGSCEKTTPKTHGAVRARLKGEKEREMKKKSSRKPPRRRSGILPLYSRFGREQNYPLQVEKVNGSPLNFTTFD